jgi:hypothetical protein
MKLIKEAYHSWGAEVVFITSNFQGNREMMEGCKEASIPAFVSQTSVTLFRALFFFFSDSGSRTGYTLGFLIYNINIRIIAANYISILFMNEKHDFYSKIGFTQRSFQVEQSSINEF